MAGSQSGWRVDDLDGGLAADLLNLSGLGSELESQYGPYNMAEVLNLSLFKEQSMSPLDPVSGPPRNNRLVVVQNTPMQQPELPPTGFKQEPPGGYFCGNSPSSIRRTEKEESAKDVTCTSGFFHVLKAPTSPGRKVTEETLTYLNQGQSYEVELQYLGDTSLHQGQFLKSVLRLCFHERRLQVMEAEKYEEWRNHRPAERILEIDVPMCVSIHNIRSVGNFSSALEFEWDPGAEVTRLYAIVNCVSSEFTKGKSGGESGVPLRIQVDTWEPGSDVEGPPCHSAGCQIKVFKPKGADRKHKTELLKLESKSQDELDQMQPPSDYTVLTELPLEPHPEDHQWRSPCPSVKPPSEAFVPSPSSGSQSYGSPQMELLYNESNQNGITPMQWTSALNPESTVEDTHAWLQLNRFHHYMNTFANFTGADLLRLSRSDMIQIIGSADGIRLHNALHARAARPVLTIYICVENQQTSEMKEYLAMFLEILTADILTKKLALRCNLRLDQIIAVYRQGPTGIYVIVDDEMVRNLMDEAQFDVQILRDEATEKYRIIMK